MEALVVRELAMDPDKFWKLSFYEFGLWVGRINHLIEERNKDRKLLIELERNSMALLANIHSTKKYSGEDFYKLPTDVKPQAAGLSEEEVMKLVKQRFKKRIKHA